VAGLYKELKKKVPSETAARIAKLDGASTKELLLTLQDIRASLGESQKLADGRDLEVSLAALFTELEPGARLEDRSSHTPNVPNFCELWLPRAGVGLKLANDSDSGMIRVVASIFRGPAYQAGIRAGDLIVAILRDVDSDGKPLAKRQVISTKGMKVEDAIKLIIGTPGTEINLRVIPAGR
jgi:C-terminal processing protease CtpA/Prc